MMQTLSRYRLQKLFEYYQHFWGYNEKNYFSYMVLIKII